MWRMCNRKCSFNKENDKASYQREVSSKTGGEEMGDPGLKCYLTDCSEDEGSRSGEMTRTPPQGRYWATQEK